MDIYEVVYYVLSPKSKFRKNVNFKKYKNVKNRKIKLIYKSLNLIF